MPFQHFEYDDPFAMLTGGMQFGQDYLQKSRMNPLEYQLKKLETQYKPLTLQADAASKLAYANLMGPQFIAKLMQNPDLLANLPDEQKKQLLAMVTQAGANQTLPPGLPGTRQDTSPVFNPSVANILKKQPNKPGMSNLPIEEQLKIQNLNLKPGDYYTIPYSQQETSEQTPLQEAITKPTGKTFAENAGEYSGVIKEGEESGKIRAQDLEDFGSKLEASQNLGDKFNSLSGLINNPVFRNLRTDMPFFQAQQLWSKSKTGTPEEQEIVGQFKNTADEFVRDTINSFSGTKLKGELDVAKNMKVSDNDSFNVIVGKVRSAMTYKQLQTQRLEMASDLMRENHIDKQQALKIADKKLNTDAVINDINKKLDYTISVRNKRTGAIENIPVSEARRRGIKNV